MRKKFNIYCLPIKYQYIFDINTFLKHNSLVDFNRSFGSQHLLGFNYKIGYINILY